MNYKRGKHTEKEIKWGSPKEYQHGYAPDTTEVEETDELADESFLENYGFLSKKRKKKSTYCRKLKADHNFVFIKHSDLQFGKHIDFCTDYLSCTGCQKKKYISKQDHV